MWVPREDQTTVQFASKQLPIPQQQQQRPFHFPSPPPPPPATSAQTFNSNWNSLSTDTDAIRSTKNRNEQLVFMMNNAKLDAAKQQQAPSFLLPSTPPSTMRPTSMTMGTFFMTPSGSESGNTQQQQQQQQFIQLPQPLPPLQSRPMPMTNPVAPTRPATASMPSISGSNSLSNNNIANSNLPQNDQAVAVGGKTRQLGTGWIPLTNFGR